MASLSDMIHGRKPDWAKLNILDPIEMLRQLMSGEIADWPQIQELGNLFQSTMFDQLSQAGLDLKSIIGLGGENVQQTQKNALALQKGELPPEDIAAIFRTSAAQNLKSGQLMSGMGGANALRNIGMGTLEGQLKGADLATSGVNAAQRWMQVAQGTLLPSSAYLYSPEWFANFRQQQETARTANLQQKYNLDAAPDPAWAHRAAMLASLLGSFAGPGGSSMGQPISQNPALSFSGATAGGTVGAMGGPSGSMAGMYGGNALGFNQQTPAQNPGFLTNFMNSYNSTDINNTGRGVGGWAGNVLGGLFNQGG